ncbi:putative teichuronic acid biosynthesis glycosyltransferase TuaH [Weizmannia acidilactici]|nr:putative teichuronic acid biosynthesis glycosyltransferase TuaH [Weizmannia acidilactici]
MGAKTLGTVHVVVAAGRWNHDRLRYRRHRLAEFLQNETREGKVIWLCPVPDKKEPERRRLPNGIIEWAIPDLFPNKIFRFGRYIDFFYEKKLRAFLDELEREKAGKYYLWYTFPGFPALSELFPWDKTVYDCSDLWSYPMEGRQTAVSFLRRKVVQQAEDRVIHKAGTIFCTSDYLYSLVLNRLGPDRAPHVHTLENGVEFAAFAGVEKRNGAPVSHSGTVFGYIGGIKPKLDFKLIQKMAERHPEWLFFLVGPDGTGRSDEFRRLLQTKNVVWKGSIPPAEVPAYMQMIDVGVMPYKPTSYNAAVFPLKLFEFLAAGKPVVGAHLPSTKKYVAEGIYAYTESDDPEDFMRLCQKMAEESADEVYRQARIRLARSKNWNGIFREMVEKVN